MLAAVALAAFLCGQGPVAVSEKLARAEGLVTSLEYDQAREALLDVVADARATAEQLKQAHLLAGEVDRVLERDVDARMHFYWVLSRDPTATLPPDKPPKVTAFFELVRDEVRAARPVPVPAQPITSSPAPREPAQQSAVPLFVIGGGALVLVSGAVGASVAELAFADGSAPFAARQQAQTLGVASWAIAAAGAAGIGAGAVWWAAQGG